MFDIYLASPRWYCAWVERAIGMLDDVVKTYKDEGPIYVNHEIVHNKLIVEYFQKKGVIFSDDIENIPPNSIMLFSAHGVAPSFVKKAQKKWLRTLDASCPLVIKVHNEAKKFISEWYKVIYIWKKNHQEALWVQDNDLKNIYVVGNKQDAKELRFSPWQKLALLNQTTLSVDDTKDLIEYVQQLYPDIQLPSFTDICYATTNRQEAVKTITQDIDALIIVWSQNSSNSQKLRDIWKKKWIPSLLIDHPEEIPKWFLENIRSLWVSSGASVPDSLVQETLKYLKSHGGNFVKEIITKEEKMIFPYTIEIQ